MIIGLPQPTNGKIIFDGGPWMRNHLTKNGSLIEYLVLYGNLTVHTKLMDIPKEKIYDVQKLLTQQTLEKTGVTVFNGDETTIRN